MSAAKKETPKTWELTGSWAGAWKIFAGIGAVGLAGAGAGYAMDPKRFAFSFLFAFVTCLTVALGAMFFVLVQRLTSAGWSVTVRRTAEFFSYGILVLIPMFAVVVLTMGHLFPWLGQHGEGHADEHGKKTEVTLSLIKDAHAQTHEAPAAAEPAAPAAAEGAAPAADHEGHGAAPAEGHARGMRLGGNVHGGMHAAPVAAEGHGAHGDPHALIHHEVMEAKAPYLNKSFFLIRAALYFLIWGFLATKFFDLSASQDKSKDPQLTLRAQRLAPAATFLFALSLTFAAFDWIMSLEPSWFSTIFGVVIFACGVVSSYAVIILVTLAMRKTGGPLEGAITVEHYHDLGKLMFGFLVFWAYVQFSQFMLIWYAALPEETTWFHNRWDHAPWSTVTTFVIVGHFVVPFFWLLSRNFKRNLGRLQVGAAFLLLMHVVDMYWFVMPNVFQGKDGFSFHWLDIACLLGVGGVYCAFVFRHMTKHALVPIGDPRLQRSLHFQNA